MSECPDADEKIFFLDTNVLIHDPTAILNFDEHDVAITMTVLEELDKLKAGKQSIAADCRQAIRSIDRLLGDADPQHVEQGVPIDRGCQSQPAGRLSIIMPPAGTFDFEKLPENLNDNQILNAIKWYAIKHPQKKVVLVSKDINMRLKARTFGFEAQDYHSDQLVDDISVLPLGHHHFEGSFWDIIDKVDTIHRGSDVEHVLVRPALSSQVHINDYLIDDMGFAARVVEMNSDTVILRDLSDDGLLHAEVWGLKPRDIYQAMALDLLMDPDVHLVNLTGAAGSGKTILALAACIEQTVAQKRYKRIIATRSTQGLDEDIGFLPGSEAEKMEPWLGAIVDNLEALHLDDENSAASVDYILGKVPIQFKSMNYIRGRSFQQSLIIIDESQNLTPHQIKTLITRAGNGSKVICLGNLAQIDTPYLNPLSSGLTYMTERFKGFPHGGGICLQGVPRSALAEFAEAHL